MSLPEPSELRVESADGTAIAVQVVGAGEVPVIIVPGSLASRGDWDMVAAELADVATVYVVDRRAHGLSEVGGPHSIEREYEDLAAVREVAGRDAIVFAHSYGAVVALGQALTDPPRALAVYEPPLPVDGPVAGPHLVTYEQAVTEGRLDDAMVLGLTRFVGVPEELVPVMRQVLPWDTLVSLTPTWVPELHAIDDLDPDLSRFTQLRSPVLEIVGELSPGGLVHASARLAEVLPDVQVERLAGQGHMGNATAPAELAAVVRAFIARVTA
jgi:pimeloyl-ACP methyl ester carboxylesterase